MSGFDNDDAMTWGVYPSFHRRWLSFVSGKASLPHYLECPEGCQKGNLLNCLILGTKRKVHDERLRTRSMYRSSRTLPEELLGANHSTRAGSPRNSRKHWQNNWRTIFVIATVGSVVIFLYVLAWPAQVVHFPVVTVGECTSASEDPNRKGTHQTLFLYFFSLLIHKLQHRTITFRLICHPFGQISKISTQFFKRSGIRRHTS